MGKFLTLKRGGFTLIEALSGIFIMSIVVIISIKSVLYLNSIQQQNEIRYLALNRLDSEMARLVMAYENNGSTPFYNESQYTHGVDWNHSFTVEGDFSTSTDKYLIYQETSPPVTGVNDGRYGLRLFSGRSLVQLKNISGDNGVVDDRDIVALLGWRVNNSVNIDNNISINLSLTYPYWYSDLDQTVTQLWDFVETINLETSTRI